MKSLIKIKIYVRYKSPPRSIKHINFNVFTYFYIILSETFGAYLSLFVAVFNFSNFTEYIRCAESFLVYT